MAAGNPGAFRRRVEPSSPEGQNLLRSIRATYLDNQYRTSLQFRELYFINNKILEQRFNLRKQRLYSVGYREEIRAYACFKKEESVYNIIKDGAAVKTSAYNYLGSSDHGVNLCRHADVQLKSAESGRSNVSKCWLVVFKVLPGKSRPVLADESVFFPSVGFDSHVSTMLPTAGDTLHQQAINSQIYLYEFTGPNSSELSRVPSNILPYAVLTFIKNAPPAPQTGIPGTQAQAMVPATSPVVAPPPLSHLPSQQAGGAMGYLGTHTNAFHQGKSQPASIPPALMRGTPNQAAGSVGYPHGNVPLQGANSAANTSTTMQALGITNMQQYRNYQALQHQQVAAMDIGYPPNQTASSTQLPFHMNPSLAARASSIQAAQQAAQSLARVQQHMDYSTGSYPLNLSQPGHRGQVRGQSSRASASARRQPDNSNANAGMRLPTASQRLLQHPQQPSASQGVAGAAENLSSLPHAVQTNRQVNVITIQPEGKAPHEDPDYQRGWPWVKGEPITSGYDEPASSYTRNLHDGGTLAKPIVIEPEDDGDGLPIDMKTHSMVQQVNKLHIPTSTLAQASEPVCDRDEFQKLYGSLSPDPESPEQAADDLTRLSGTSAVPLTSGTSIVPDRTSSMSLPIMAGSPRIAPLSSSYFSTTATNSSSKFTHNSASHEMPSQTPTTNSTVVVTSPSIWNQFMARPTFPESSSSISSFNKEAVGKHTEELERPENAPVSLSTGSHTEKTASNTHDQTINLPTRRQSDDIDKAVAEREASEASQDSSNGRVGRIDSNRRGSSSSSGHRVSVCGTWSVPKSKEGEGLSRPSSANSVASSPHMSALLGFGVDSPVPLSTENSTSVTTNTIAQAIAITTTTTAVFSSEQTPRSVTLTSAQYHESANNNLHSSVPMLQSSSLSAVSLSSVTVCSSISANSAATTTTTTNVYDNFATVVTAIVDKSVRMSSSPALSCHSNSSNSDATRTEVTIVKNTTLTESNHPPLNMPMSEVLTSSNKPLASHSRTCERSLSNTDKSSHIQESAPVLDEVTSGIRETPKRDLEPASHCDPTTQIKASENRSTTTNGEVSGLTSKTIERTIGTVLTGNDDTITENSVAMVHSSQTVAKKAVTETTVVDSVSIGEMNSGSVVKQTVAGSTEIKDASASKTTEVDNNNTRDRRVVSKDISVPVDKTPVNEIVNSNNSQRTIESSKVLPSDSSSLSCIDIKPKIDVTVLKDEKVTASVLDSDKISRKTNEEIVADSKISVVDMHLIKSEVTISESKKSKPQDTEVPKALTAEQPIAMLSSKHGASGISAVDIQEIPSTSGLQKNSQVKASNATGITADQGEGHTGLRTRSRTPTIVEGSVDAKNAKTERKHREKQKNKTHQPLKAKMTKLLERHKTVVGEDGTISLIVETVYELGNSSANPIGESDDVTILDNNSIGTETGEQGHSAARCSIRPANSRRQDAGEEGGVIDVDKVLPKAIQANTRAAVTKPPVVTTDVFSPAIGNDDKLRKRLPVNSFTEREARLTRRIPVSKKSCTPRKKALEQLRAKIQESCGNKVETDTPVEMSVHAKQSAAVEDNINVALSSDQQLPGPSYRLSEVTNGEEESQVREREYLNSAAEPQINQVLSGRSTPVDDKVVQTKELQPVVLLKYDIGHLLQDYNSFEEENDAETHPTTPVPQDQLTGYDEEAEQNEGENELNLKISAVTSLEADTEVAEAFNHLPPSASPIYNDDTISENEWEINPGAGNNLNDSASMSMSDTDMPTGLRKITLRKTGHVKEGLQITIKANKPISDVTFDTEEGTNRDASEENVPQTRKTSLRRKKSVNYSDTLRKKHWDVSDSGSDGEQKLLERNTRKTRTGRSRTKELVNKPEKTVQLKSKVNVVEVAHVDKKKKGHHHHQYKSKEFVESSDSESQGKNSVDANEEVIKTKDKGLAPDSVDKASVDKASVDKASVDKASVDKASVDTASVDKASVDTASVDKASVDKASVDTASVDKASVDKEKESEEQHKADRRHKKKKHRKKSKRSEERRTETKSAVVAVLEKVFEDISESKTTKEAKETKVEDVDVKKVDTSVKMEGGFSTEGIDEALKVFRRESEVAENELNDKKSTVAGSIKDGENNHSKAASLVRSERLSDSSSVKSSKESIDSERVKTTSGKRDIPERYTRKRIFSKSRSRSPEVSRRKRPRSRSRSRSRSYSPYSRKGRSFRSPRRRYSRSPSPRRRRSRSPGHRRRYSRSPSPYSIKGRRRGRYSPRRKYSRSPSPRNRRRSRSISPSRRYSRSPSPSRRYSRSRSRSPPRKRFTTAPVKTGKERPYSPSSPTSSPIKILSPASSTKAFVEKMGRTATDELFDIAFGKAPVVHVQSSTQSSGTSTATTITTVTSTASTTTLSTTTSTTTTTSSVDEAPTVTTTKATPNAPPSDVLELFSPAYADKKDKTTGKGTPTPDEKASPPKKLTISQYKSRKSIVETEGEGKSKRVQEKRSSTDSNNSKSDDSDIASIQKQYHMLKETIDSYPSDDEGKLDMMIEYKRVGEELKLLRAKHSGKNEPGTPLALPALSIVTTSVTTTVTTVPSSTSPRKLFNLSPMKGAFENMKPEWQLNSMDPEAGNVAEKYDGYKIKSQDLVSAEKGTGNSIMDNIGTILQKIGIPKNSNSSDFQKIVTLAKESVQSDSGKSNSTSIKPLMSQDIPTPTLRSNMNSRKSAKQPPPLPPPVKPPPLPPTENTDQPVFFTDIKNARANALASKIHSAPGNIEPRRAIARDPRIAKQISVDGATSSAVTRDPRLSRQTSYNPDMTGHSPRDQVGMTSPRGLSPRGAVSPLPGMVSPTHISPRQQQQQQQQHQYYHAQMLPPPLVNHEPLPLIPIDVPEINYEGIQGLLDDPRFQPRDPVCWNERPVKHLRMIPWEVVADIEEVEMEIVEDKEGGTVEGNGKKTSFKMNEDNESSDTDKAKQPDSKSGSKEEEQQNENRKRHASAEVKQDHAVPKAKAEHLHELSHSHDHNKNSKEDIQCALGEGIGNEPKEIVQPSSAVDGAVSSALESHMVKTNKNSQAETELKVQAHADTGIKFYNPKDSLRASRTITTDNKALTSSSNLVIGNKNSFFNKTNNSSSNNSGNNNAATSRKDGKDTLVSAPATGTSNQQELKCFKGSRAASRWSTMSANWNSSRNATITQPAHESESLVGEADSEVISHMTTVEEYSEKWYNQLSVEMSRHLDVRLRKIKEEKLYHNPTEGVTPEMREQLLEEKSLNQRVQKELQTEHNLSKMTSKIQQAEREAADLRKQREEEGSTPEILTKLTKHQIALHVMQLTCVTLHKRLEDLHRYQKSEYVEVIPDEFLLEGERFVSKEGCLLFLMEKMTVHDCRHLYAYKLEIEMCRNKLEKTKPFLRSEIKNLWTYLGYWHSQRRQLLENLCCKSASQQDTLLKRITEKLIWCRGVQIELESKARTEMEEVMLLGFLLSRIETLVTYHSTIENARLNQNVWWIPKSSAASSAIQTTRPQTPHLSPEAAPQATSAPSSSTLIWSIHKTESSSLTSTSISEPSPSHSTVILQGKDGLASCIDSGTELSSNIAKTPLSVPQNQTEQRSGLESVSSVVDRDPLFQGSEVTVSHELDMEIGTSPIGQPGLSASASGGMNPGGPAELIVTCGEGEVSDQGKSIGGKTVEAAHDKVDRKHSAKVKASVVISSVLSSHRRKSHEGSVAGKKDSKTHHGASKSAGSSGAMKSTTPTKSRQKETSGSSGSKTSKAGEKNKDSSQKKNSSELSTSDKSKAIDKTRARVNEIVVSVISKSSKNEETKHHKIAKHAEKEEVAVVKESSNKPGVEESKIGNVQQLKPPKTVPTHRRKSHESSVTNKSPPKRSRSQSGEKDNSKPVKTDGKDSKPVKTEGKDSKPVKTEGKDSKPVKTEGKDIIPVKTEGKDIIPVKTEGKDIIPVKTEAKESVEAEAKESKQVETEVKVDKPNEIDGKASKLIKTQSKDSKPDKTEEKDTVKTDAKHSKPVKTEVKSSKPVKTETKVNKPVEIEAKTKETSEMKSHVDKKSLSKVKSDTSQKEEKKVPAPGKASHRRKSGDNAATTKMETKATSSIMMPSKNIKPHVTSTKQSIGDQAKNNTRGSDDSKKDEASVGVVKDDSLGKVSEDKPLQKLSKDSNTRQMSTENTNAKDLPTGSGDTKTQTHKKTKTEHSKDSAVPIKLAKPEGIKQPVGEKNPSAGDMSNSTKSEPKAVEVATKSCAKALEFKDEIKKSHSLQTKVQTETKSSSSKKDLTKLDVKENDKASVELVKATSASAEHKDTCKEKVSMVKISENKNSQNDSISDQLITNKVEKKSDTKDVILSSAEKSTSTSKTEANSSKAIQDVAKSVETNVVPQNALKNEKQSSGINKKKPNSASGKKLTETPVVIPTSSIVSPDKPSGVDTESDVSNDDATPSGCKGSRQPKRSIVVKGKESSGKTPQKKRRPVRIPTSPVSCTSNKKLRSNRMVVPKMTTTANMTSAADCSVQEKSKQPKGDVKLTKPAEIKLDSNALPPSDTKAKCIASKDAVDDKTKAEHPQDEGSQITDAVQSKDSCEADLDKIVTDKLDLVSKNLRLRSNKISSEKIKPSTHVTKIIPTETVTTPTHSCQKPIGRLRDIELKRSVSVSLDKTPMTGESTLDNRNPVDTKETQKLSVSNSKDAEIELEVKDRSEEKTTRRVVLVKESVEHPTRKDSKPCGRKVFTVNEKTTSERNQSNMEEKPDSSAKGKDRTNDSDTDKFIRNRRVYIVKDSLSEEDLASGEKTADGRAEEIPSRKRNHSQESSDSDISKKRIKLTEEEKYTLCEGFENDLKYESSKYQPSKRVGRSLSSQQGYNGTPKWRHLSQRETYSDSDSHKCSPKYRTDRPYRENSGSSPVGNRTSGLARNRTTSIEGRSAEGERRRNVDDDKYLDRIHSPHSRPVASSYIRGSPEVDIPYSTRGYEEKRFHYSSKSISPKRRSRSREGYYQADRRPSSPDGYTKASDRNDTQWSSSMRQASLDYHHSLGSERRSLYVSRSPESRTYDANSRSPEARSWSREGSPSDARSWGSNRPGLPDASSYKGADRQRSGSSERQYSPYRAYESSSRISRYSEDRVDSTRNTRDDFVDSRDITPPRPITPVEPVLRRSPRKGHKRPWSPSHQEREKFDNYGSKEPYETGTSEESFSSSKRGRGSRGRPRGSRGRPRGRGRGRGVIPPTTTTTMTRGAETSENRGRSPLREPYGDGDTRGSWGSSDRGGVRRSRSPRRGGYRGRGRGRARAIQDMKEAIDKATDVISQAMLKMSEQSSWNSLPASGANNTNHRLPVNSDVGADLSTFTQELPFRSHDLDRGMNHIPSLVSAVPTRQNTLQNNYNDRDYRYQQSRPYYM